MNQLILSIETATMGGGVCLLRGNELLAEVLGDPGLSHSNTLLRDIEQCFRNSSLNISDVDLFAAASGPGSFTGLRIGLATIKALAVALDRRCVGVPTLHAIAHSAGSSEATVALLPAGRGEVFVQLFSVGDDVSEVDAAAHLPPGRAIERYSYLRNVKWAGAGAAVHRNLIEQAANNQALAFKVLGNSNNETQQWDWCVVEGKTSLAKHVAILAQRRCQTNDLVTPEELSAVYLRPSDAELKCN